MTHRDATRLLTGISVMVLAMLSFAIMSLLIRLLSFDLPPPQMVFMRNFISTLLLLPVMLYHGTAEMKTGRIGRHVWRSMVGIVAMESWFYSLAHMPLNEAVALSFTTPLFTVVFAVLLLGEKIGPLRLLALVIGFAGAMLILHPRIEAGHHTVAFVALFAAAMMAISGIVVKTLTATDPPWRIVAYMSLFMTLFAAPLGIAAWQPVTPYDWLVAAGIALFSTLGQYFMAEAFLRAPMVVLAPFDFTRLVFTSILAYIVLQETLGVWTVIGALVIVASAAFIAWRESKRAEHAAP